ncbi:MAG: NAD(P)-binding domain-containing protein, partial [Candidatus Hodarchaeales archaeon]
LGHRVYVENDAGEAAGFHNEAYEQAGGIIVYDEEEIYGRPDLLVKFSRPMYSELQMMKEGMILMGFLYLHATKRDKIELILEKQITSISCELIRTNGDHPVLGAISALAGQLVPQIASQHLNNLHGGPGVVLGGGPGIPPAEVVIIGCGNAGSEIARNFIQVGAQVTVLDPNPSSLKRLHQSLGMGSRVVTMLSMQSTIEKVVKYADVLVLAVQIPGKRSPILITEEMVKTMKSRSVIIDLSIDQGGATETSRLTNHKSPTFVKHGVIHYCVPNLSSIVARTASYAYNNAFRPFICKIADSKDVKELISDPIIKTGIVTYKGEVSHPSLQKKVDSSVSLEETQRHSKI